MEKTVNTAWYAKKCALGTLVCCGTELVLLMLASALILRGAISLSCDRLDFFFGKLCESLPNQFLLFGQVEVHVLFLQFHYNMCFNNTQRN